MAKKKLVQTPEPLRGIVFVPDAALSSRLLDSTRASTTRVNNH